MEHRTFFYDKQITNYILQFMAIFTVFEVEVGRRNDQPPRLISVPIRYASQDRVAAAIVADNTQNLPVRLPMFSAYIQSIENAPERRKGIDVVRRQRYVPMGGTIPTDAQVVYQRTAVPYVLNMELTINTSNLDQMCQLVEQILTTFNPSITIQTSDAPLDTTRLTSVELTNILWPDPIVQETERRILQTTLIFEMPIYLDIPADLRKNIIEKINVRIGAVDYNTNDSADIVESLNEMGVEYDTILDASHLPIE